VSFPAGRFAQWRHALVLEIDSAGRISQTGNFMKQLEDLCVMVQVLIFIVAIESPHVIPRKNYNKGVSAASQLSLSSNF
jgi:hypothetical protein